MNGGDGMERRGGGRGEGPRMLVLRPRVRGGGGGHDSPVQRTKRGKKIIRISLQNISWVDGPPPALRATIFYIKIPL